MTMWPESGNTGLTRHIYGDSDDLDLTEPIDFAEAFGVAIEQPTERERALHRTARQRTNAPGHDHPNRRFEQ